MNTSFSGLKSESHLAVRPNGYGVNNRGSLVGVIEGRNLKHLLLGLPEKYGGWVAIHDAGGRLVAATDPEAERLDSGALGEPGSVGTLSLDSGSYRTYRARSSIRGWDYVAALSVKRILADARAVRDAALLMLGLGFFGACAVSYWFAYAHSRPLGKLFSLLMPEARRDEGPKASIYEKAEKAIAGLSVSRSRLGEELKETERIVRVEFFHRLLDGTHSDRKAFLAETERLGIALGEGARRVLLSQSDILLRVLACEIGDDRFFESSLRRYLLNTCKFFSRYPFTSIALDDPRFDPSSACNSWAGPVNFLSLATAPAAFEHHGRHVELGFVMQPVLSAAMRFSKFPQCISPWTEEEGFTEGYTPTMLCILDYVEGLCGIMPRPEAAGCFGKPEST
jgi:hypothetical protein